MMKNNFNSVCPLCQATDQQFVFSERNHDLVRCQSCDLFFIVPYPERREDVYDTVSEYEYEDLEILDCKRHYEASILYHDYLYPTLRNEFQDVRSALDIGCGTGRLLELLSEFPNIKRVGIELNKTRAAFARDKAKCDIIETPVEQIDVKDPFDTIALMNIMSHVPDVLAFIRCLEPLLADHGKLIVKIGEMKSDVKKTAIYDWQIPDHLQFFGLRTIENLANQTGFQVVRQERTPLAHEMFSKWRWLAPGRNSYRNLAKMCIANAPFALRILRRMYEMWNRESVYSSIIVMKKRFTS